MKCVHFLTIFLSIFLSSFLIAEDIQLLYPDNNASSKPLIEFRMRNDTSTGHAYILMGRELDNGLKVYHSAAGFYPKTDKAFNLVAGPGTLKYKIEDVRTDDSFQAYITNEQERTAKFIIKNWDTKVFALPAQNCVSLVKNVGRAVGLNVSTLDPRALTPKGVIKNLKDNNSYNQPLQYSIKQKNLKKESLSKRQHEHKLTVAKKKNRAEEIKNSKKTRKSLQDLLPGPTPVVNKNKNNHAPIVKAEESPAVQRKEAVKEKKDAPPNIPIILN